MVGKMARLRRHWMLLIQSLTIIKQENSSWPIHFVSELNWQTIYNNQASDNWTQGQNVSGTIPSSDILRFKLFRPSKISMCIEWRMQRETKYQTQQSDFRGYKRLIQNLKLMDITCSPLKFPNAVPLIWTQLFATFLTSLTPDQGFFGIGGRNLQML